MAENPTVKSGLGNEVFGTDIVPITPNDSTDLPSAARAIRCKPITGTAGTLKITCWNGQERTTEIAVGDELVVYATRVWATGTTATGLEAIL